MARLNEKTETVDKKENFGDILKRIRLRDGLTLRMFCNRAGLDAAFWSKVEQGEFYPPTGRELRNIMVLSGLRMTVYEWERLNETADKPELLTEEEKVLRDREFKLSRKFYEARKERVMEVGYNDEFFSDSEEN